MVSQRPRYYLLALLAVLALDAVLATRLWPQRRRLVAALVGVTLLASTVIVAVRHAAGQGLPAPGGGTDPRPAVVARAKL